MLFAYGGILGRARRNCKRRWPGGAGRAFRVPGYPWTPGLFVLAALYVVASSILANPRNALIGAGLLALGVPVYLLAARYSGRGVV